MLNLFRRHEQSCKHETRSHLKCHCPIWLDWRIHGSRLRKPIGTRDWQVAQGRARQMEADGLQSVAVPKTIKEATEEFIKDAETRNLKEPTIRKYKWLFRSLDTHATNRGLVFIGQLSQEETRVFRNGWTLSPRTAGKQLERLKAFLKFCQDVGFIRDNPASKIKPPRVTAAPVIPFSDKEVEAVLAGCDAYSGNGKRLKVLTQLMLQTGLRISDASTISKDKILHDSDGFSVELWMTKTDEKICCAIRPELAADLKALPNDHPFWTGESNTEDCAAGWRKAYSRLFRQAGITGHIHQFRHTFATRLLRNGVSLDDVSILLGHSSVRITQRHYAAWTKERRQRLLEAVRKTW